MFNSSLRSVARNCPNASIPTRTVTTPSSSKAIATFSTRCHQRRHSSSKPPVPPNNGSPPIPADSVKQVGAPRSTDKRPGAESRLSKRKVAKGDKTEPGKQVQDIKGNEWTLQLPSVPSTQHLHPKDVYVASFFSTHRPLSITGPLPPETQIEDFDKIFQSRPKRPRNGAAEVIYTLSSAVQNLDDHVHRGQQQGMQQSEQQVEQRVDIIKALTQHNNAVGDGNQTTHLDGQPQRAQGSNVKLMIQEIARRFRPFHAPPPPVPAPEVDLLGTKQNAESENEEEMQAGQLELEIERQDGEKTILRLQNINFDSNPNPDLQSGQFFTSKPIMSDPQSAFNITEPSNRNRSQGSRVRRRVYVDPQRNARNLKYYAISVKRQRKLKMKKHKYKKLMRKTRNLRRRQDRL